MKEYLRLFSENKEVLAFGILLTFFSSFGQTFLLSLYLPSLKDYFDLSDSRIGQLYGAATLTSAFVLTYTGRYIDKISLKKYLLFVVIGFGLVNILLGFSYSILMVFISIFGLRHFGQGLMSHTSMTVMSRYFDAARGKALSFAAFGYPLGEAIMPSIVVVLIAFFDWRLSLIIIGCFILLFVLPILFTLEKKIPKLKAIENQTDNTERSWGQLDVLFDKRFYIIGPNIFSMSLIITAILFYQLSLADFKNWSHAWMAGSLIGYAISGTASIFLSGWLIDNFSAKKIFPFFLLPMALGIFILSISDHQLSYSIFLILAGVSAGIGSPVKDAAIAEVYGTKTIGTVRSLFTALMVLSTAIGPVLIGFFIDFYSFNHAFYACIALICLSFFPGLLFLKNERLKKN